jgi:hypothetical protein
MPMSVSMKDPITPTNERSMETPQRMLSRFMGGNARPAAARPSRVLPV